MLRPVVLHLDAERPLQQLLLRSRLTQLSVTHREFYEDAGDLFVVLAVGLLLLAEDPGQRFYLPIIPPVSYTHLTLPTILRV